MSQRKAVAKTKRRIEITVERHRRVVLSRQNCSTDTWGDDDPQFLPTSGMLHIVMKDGTTQDIDLRKVSQLQLTNLSDNG